MRTGGRRERVAERVRQEVAAILRFDLADPRVGRATVTRVSMTGDLALARVYVSVLGEPAQQQETLTALRRAGGRVRSLLGSRLRLRGTPEVRFVFDPSVEFGIRLEEILEAERARSPQDETEDEAAAVEPGESPAGEPVETAPGETAPGESPAAEAPEAAPGEAETPPPGAGAGSTGTGRAGGGNDPKSGPEGSA